MIDKNPSGSFSVSKIPPQFSLLENSFQQEALSNPVEANIPIAFFPAGFRTIQSIESMSPAELTAGVELLARIENPKLTTTSTVNCSACHVTNATLRFAMRTRGIDEIPATPTWFSDPLVGNITRMVPAKPDRLNMHAFSYKGSIFSVSPRATNETAAVVDFLNSQGFVDHLNPNAKQKYLTSD